ncbi:MAG: hypothetical protein IIX34_03140, partial [Alistipes sp.]|nr:hypothetical protein [Alistipes sp.]
MKKIFRLMLAVAAIASVVSCAKEAAIPAGEEVEVSFVANLAGAPGSRAIADGTTVDEVAYAIYESGSNIPTSLKGTLVLDANKQATFSTRLVAGKIYDIAFFAYKKDDTNGRPLHYTIDWDEQTVTMNVTAETKANDETLDCFWRVAPGIDVKKQDKYDFDLFRPLSQLNLGVTDQDVKNAKAAGFSVTASQIVVDAYKTFNLFNGEVSNPIQKAVFIKNASPVAVEAPETPEILKVEGDDTKYYYLATTYLFAKETSTVKVTLWANDGNELNTLEYSFVPFQRNYRTNILGELLTNPATFSIVVDEKFANDFNGPDFQ